MVTWSGSPDLASQIEENYHVDKNVAKLKVRDVLLKLLSAGEVQAQKFDDAESGETLSLYFAKSGDEKVSGLHRYMVRQLLDRLSRESGKGPQRGRVWAEPRRCRDRERILRDRDGAQDEDERP